MCIIPFKNVPEQTINAFAGRWPELRRTTPTMLELSTAISTTSSSMIFKFFICLYPAFLPFSLLFALVSAFLPGPFWSAPGTFHQCRILEVFDRGANYTLKYPKIPQNRLKYLKSTSTNIPKYIKNTRKIPQKYLEKYPENGCPN